MKEITSERVVEMLRERGTEISVEEAASILKVMRMLADAVVEGHVKTLNDEKVEIGNPSA
jgi:hypothetical protein